MLKPIIEIPRVDPNVTKALIKKGILIVTSDGIKCKENSPAADQSKRGY